MSQVLQAIRGMNDIVPSEAAVWQFVESQLRDIVSQYGYREIRFPIVEKTDLFKRAVGETSDIVEKEMYTFLDRNEDSLTLRPEGTAPCVRAGIEQGLLFNQVQRLWYTGPMFRHERPQKGRYRQFYQFGVEAFGMSDPSVDAELIAMTARFWQALGISDAVTLELNSLGTTAARLAHREALTAYFEQHRDQLDEDSLRRLTRNPLRILDSKNPDLKDCIANAPALANYFDEASTTHFNQLKAHLDALNITYRINPQLVRGLDYYTHTVFEWVTDKLGSQNAVCAGGRYDGLVEQIGGKATPAMGFAMGLERLIAVMQACETAPAEHPLADVYCICEAETDRINALVAIEQCRAALPERQFVLDCVGGNVKKQFKRADQHQATLAWVFQGDTVKIKFLKTEQPPNTLKSDKLLTWVSDFF